MNSATSLIPASMQTELRKLHEAGLSASWSPWADHATIRTSAEGIDDDVRWYCELAYGGFKGKAYGAKGSIRSCTRAALDDAGKRLAAAHRASVDDRKRRRDPQKKEAAETAAAGALRALALVEATLASFDELWPPAWPSGGPAAGGWREALLSCLGCAIGEDDAPDAEAAREAVTSKIIDLAAERDRAEAELAPLRLLATAVGRERSLRRAWLSTLPECASRPDGLLVAEEATGSALEAIGSGGGAAGPLAFGDRVTVTEDLWVIPPMPGGPGMIRQGAVGVVVADPDERVTVRWRGAPQDMGVSASALRKVEG